MSQRPRTSAAFFASIAPIALLCAAALSTPLFAGDGGASERHQRSEPRPERQQAPPPQRVADWFDYAMQAVEHDTTPDGRAYGWRYYSDPTTQRAVVISPQGDYYYSRGKGLHWVAAEQI